MNMEIQPIGNNWFSLYTGGGFFEYNTTANPTAQKQVDRRPLAQVYRHIDGGKVIAKITGKPEAVFFYKDSSYEKALHLAKCFIENYFRELNIQCDIFSDA